MHQAVWFGEARGDGAGVAEIRKTQDVPIAAGGASGRAASVRVSRAHRLGAGAVLPPLLLDDEEAVAVAGGKIRTGPIPLDLEEGKQDGGGGHMKMTDLFLADLEREAASARRTLERVPEGRNDWKPHEKSMPLGYLATLVATIPGWVEMMVKQDELDMQPIGGQRFRPKVLETRAELLEALDASAEKARAALAGTTDEHLMTPWRFLVGGRVASEQQRHVMIRDAVFSHLAHHRGQLTVYLRLNGAPVPAIYGPSADEGIP